MGLLDRIAGSRGEVRYSADTWLSQYLIPATQFGFNGSLYQTSPLGLAQTLAGNRAYEITNTMPGYLAALRTSPPAFAAQLVRAQVLSQARFVFRNWPWHPSTPRRLFSTRELNLVQRPWKNATTGELIARMEWHAGLAGNAYVARRPDRLRVLRPDWVAILYGSDLEPEDPGHALDGELLGYVYWNQGPFGGYRPNTLLPDQVAAWSPLPDPESPGMGMSWITPALREIQKDGLATTHTMRYFENGAPQPLDARVLTPTGWSTMGEMRVGSRVIGSDGKPHEVLAVYPQGERDIYRVTFSGGAQVECTDDHLWSVASYADRRSGVTRQMTLSQIAADGPRYRSGPAKWSVPLVTPVEFDAAGVLPVDPYLVGCLLGDGYLRGNMKGSGAASLACHSDDVDEQIQLLAPTLPPGNRIIRRTGSGLSSELSLASDFGKVDGAPRVNPLTELLKQLGLWGVIGHEKFIPDAYMRAPVGARVALLQGLMDTDGSVEKTQPNSLRFYNTSERLCAQVADLAGTLGGVAAVRRSHNAARPGNARPQWRVGISRLPEWIVPCRLKRKAARYRPTLRGGSYRYMQRIEYVGRKPAQCIGVDSADHLYVTDGYILTHNTPNLVVKGLTGPNGAIPTREQFLEIVDMMEEGHAGVRNAYKSLYLTAGADATIVGANLKDIDLKGVNGSAETRIAMLSRVHPVVLAAAEGLAGSSLNSGNFNAARRIWADSWIYPTLQDLAAAVAPLVNVPADAELWTDVTDMPILREDAKDAADIAQVQATAIRALTDGGYEPASVVATIAPDWTTSLKHTGKLSVQLQEPGAAPAKPPTGEAQP